MIPSGYFIHRRVRIVRGDGLDGKVKYSFASYMRRWQTRIRGCPKVLAESFGERLKAIRNVLGGEYHDSCKQLVHRLV